MTPKETGQQQLMLTIGADQFGEGGITQTISITVVKSDQPPKRKNKVPRDAN